MKIVTFLIIILLSASAFANICQSNSLVTCGRSVDLTDATLIYQPRFVKPQNQLAGISPFSASGVCKALGFSTAIGSETSKVNYDVQLARLSDEGQLEGSDVGQTYISSITCQ